MLVFWYVSWLWHVAKWNPVVFLIICVCALGDSFSDVLWRKLALVEEIGKYRDSGKVMFWNFHVI